MFAITRGSGFHMTFANGWAISVQFSPYNYCDKRSYGSTAITPNPGTGAYESKTAEVAVTKPDGSFARISDCDTVMGWQTPAQVAALIAQVVAGTVVEYPAPVYD